MRNENIKINYKENRGMIYNNKHKLFIRLVGISLSAIFLLIATGCSCENKGIDNSSAAAIPAGSSSMAGSSTGSSRVVGSSVGSSDAIGNSASSSAVGDSSVNTENGSGALIYHTAKYDVVYSNFSPNEADPSGVTVCIKVTDQAIIDDIKKNGYGKLDEIYTEVEKQLKEDGIKYDTLYADLDGWIPS